VKVLRGDLHIHTCLSPCAEETMVPSTIVKEARSRELDVIAICDHNTSENAPSVKSAAAATGLAVIEGMEITSKEEVHVLALFADDAGMLAVQDEVYSHLEGENDPEFFGEQWVVDDHDRVLGENPRLLIGATDLSLGDIVDLVHEHSGIVIASHVERPSFSLLSQLGFIPDDLPLDGLETCADVRTDWGSELAVIRSSDAHRPSEIGRHATRFLVENGTMREIALALKGARGRGILEET
jgi:PHP family Zn ribbon phosphoesterase